MVVGAHTGTSHRGSKPGTIIWPLPKPEHCLDTAAVIQFTALLALFANLCLLALAGLAVAARFNTAAADALAAVRESAAGPTALWLGFLVALASMVGSLYYSEVAGFVPCTLCWYQRIAMYPLVPILGIAAATRDWSVRGYTLVLAGIGAAIALYHYLLEWFPSLEGGVCSATLPCSLIWFRKFGFVTIPYQALSGFLLIAAILIVLRPGRDTAG